MIDDAESKGLITPGKVSSYYCVNMEGRVEELAGSP
jgi:hypothetical protein